MDLPGIPDAVAWPDVAAALESWGLPLNQLPREGISITWDAITCEVYALNEDGQKYVDKRTEQVATHRICIPIKH